MDKFLLFRFVPTMACNYHCSYCFIPDGEKEVKKSMFDLHSPEDWINAMSLWNGYDVEFYMWGGEPFSVDGTYDVVKGWSMLSHVVHNSRIDTNMSYVEKILKRCPTPKVKLNCSWHREYEGLESYFEKIKQLKELDMVGMANFVINDENLNFLKLRYGMSLSELVAKFDKIDVFMNIAVDFDVYRSGSFYERWKYGRMVKKYTCPQDLENLQCKKQAGNCHASKHFFTVHHDGSITQCASGEVVGNFFDGTIKVENEIFCKKDCPSIIAYPFRTDNEYPGRNSLMSYVDRNQRYRLENL